MQCPLCGGEFDDITLQTENGGVFDCYQCSQCGSFWLEQLPDETLVGKSVASYDTPQPNFSLKSSDLFCPTDQVIMTNDDNDDLPVGLKMWRCTNCGGTFFPKGQLALYAQWQKSQSPIPSQPIITRPKASLAVGLLALLFVSVLGSINKVDLLYSASSGSPLPSTGPNIIALILLAVAYFAGTIIAVLGRKLPLIIIGWSVIVACMFGFAVVIFGP